MKPFHVKSSAYIKSNDKDCKFAAGDHVRISKQNHFCKRLYSMLVRRSFFVKKITNTVPWTYVISDFKGEEIVGKFYERELQIKQSLELKK